jgi:hypothetical protein
LQQALAEVAIEALSLDCFVEEGTLRLTSQDSLKSSCGRRQREPLDRAYFGRARPAFLAAAGQFLFGVLSGSASGLNIQEVEFGPTAKPESKSTWFACGSPLKRKELSAIPTMTAPMIVLIESLPLYVSESGAPT